MRRWLKSMAWGAVVGAVLGVLHASGVLDPLVMFWPSKSHRAHYDYAWNLSRSEYLSHFRTYPIYWAIVGVAGGMIWCWLTRDMVLPAPASLPDRSAPVPVPAKAPPGRPRRRR